MIIGPRLGSVFTLLVFSLSILSSADVAASFIQTNDVKLDSKDEYLISGNDPFFVLKTALEPSTDDAHDKMRYLGIQLALLAGKIPKRLPLEVFFRRIEREAGAVYDPLFRFKFSVLTADLQSSGGKLAVRLPDNINLIDVPSIRLDLDACSTCLVRLSEQANLYTVSKNGGDSANALADYKIVHVQRFFNGAYSLPDSGLELSLKEWTANDADLDESFLSIVGNDPYLVSPPLDIDTHSLGGVLFSLSPPAEIESIDLQLFYATDSHAFIESASSLMRVPVKHGISQFLVPLDYLANEQPSAQILERLRLDIDSRAIGIWTLNKVELLNRQQFKESLSLIPSRILQRKLQRAQGWRLLVKAVKKVAGDIYFIIAYLFLLVLTAFGSWKSYRK